MESYITEWLSLLVRWIHVIAGIAWIGHAFLFHSFEHRLRPPEVEGVDKDVKGELWMVHGGGFFRMQKTRVLPDKYTGDLLWFKWEAAFTWLSGVVLLILVFYLGGGIYLIDPSISPLGVGPTIAAGAGTLIAGWLIYDLLWSSPLGKNNAVAGTITVAMVVGAAIGLSQLMSGRAAFIHVGALLGTIMTANVWMRILPGMRKMLAALNAGREPDLGLGAIGKQRSLHNGYMHFPIIFIMISNHFPSTYAHELNWLVLLLIMV
ncbi:MAG: urate hydroxylase PuuD, partial [Myxococcota bacterium]